MEEVLNLTLKYLLGEDKYEINKTETEDSIEYKVEVEKELLGRAIGKRGETASAIRNVQRELAKVTKSDKKIDITFVEKETEQE